MLYSLLMDASTLDLARSFKEWCAELGYEAEGEDPETGRWGVNKEAEAIWETVKTQSRKLTNLLGADFYKFQEASTDY